MKLYNKPLFPARSFPPFLLSPLTHHHRFPRSSFLCIFLERDGVGWDRVGEEIPEGDLYEAGKPVLRDS